MTKGIIFISAFFILVFILLKGCLITGGTHGSIKGYQYSVSKYVLDSAVKVAIASNSNISNDTSIGYYNDGQSYITINIKQPDMNYNYIFRYYGGPETWDSSPALSELFICYAYDGNGNGGSEGGGEVDWFHWNLRKRLLRPFEKELITAVDSILKVKHSKPD